MLNETWKSGRDYELVAGDASEKLPEFIKQGKRFDRIVGINFMHYLNPLQSASVLSCIKKLLNPQGKAFLCMCAPNELTSIAVYLKARNLHEHYRGYMVKHLKNKKIEEALHLSFKETVNPTQMLRGWYYSESEIWYQEREGYESQPFFYWDSQTALRYLKNFEKPQWSYKVYYMDADGKTVDEVIKWEKGYLLCVEIKSEVLSKWRL